MKKRIIMPAVLALTLSLMSQEAAKAQKEAPDVPSALQEPEVSKPDRGEEFRARQVKLMEKALKDIGVTEEEQASIFALQKKHMEKMKANWKRLNAARKDLSRLQDVSAPMGEIEVAIQSVADAQAEQLRLIAYNRREMETILGKEKNDQFMKNARKQFRRHGRHPGPDMPPRPSSPPLPPGTERSEAPPVPQTD